MRVFTWRDRVRVTTGEITRPQLLALRRDIGSMAGALDGMTNDDALMYLDDVLALNATRKIEVFSDGDGWVDVKAPASVVMDGDTYTFEWPMTPALFDALPSSLTSPWLDWVQEENEFVISTFLSFLNSPMNTTRSPAPTSGGVPPSGRPRKKRPTTRTTGA